MNLSLGFSPCPNDTFIFDAMLHGRIDTEGLEFEVFMEDVESLNRRAMLGELDVTKLSYHAYAYLLEKYVLLDAGSALGKNCGPLLIARHQMTDAEVEKALIAIPGKFTTANFLLSLAFPSATRKLETVFSNIENAVLEGQVDAGLIIHENRFTYEQKGLVKIIDLGEFWEASTGMPIPLGGIVVRRSLEEAVRQKVNRVMERSVRYAFEHPAASKDFVQANAQEMEESVMNNHIKLYVNDYTKNLGGAGRAAIGKLFDVARARGIVPIYKEDIFLN
ncbi:MAG: 1,4-dihydroxy-6-naphthoate synthase [Saprospiraceae bacterium]|nr:1,4-dihydroxy-6-naphthoate synthase [Saprospiraceae bacterium]MCF8250443.1 1,4-dihydroxy-6-naphthoate synthase [Saprospiraceae bacterium]MCF8282116.1 1,4-dihydroxy-6-naphthoate synthase [Bacteroidales bacterium]MCF8312411.1 1,4-dihydroxy-6-naphthoate synthase [Saprospiraceae bacterium]MCF8440592.1 1,4-dihydroxy-6-naphthoate synthase [Saprospiraceae bacterium]